MATAEPLIASTGLPITRRLVVIVFAGLCAVLALGYYLFLRTDYEILYTGVKAADASAIVAELDAKGISHRLRDDGTTILVPADQADNVRLAVAGSDLPLKGSVGFELFNKSDMGLTDFAQKINYQRALQGELTRTIVMMDGIETARVHLAIPERSLFRGDRSAPKAAVEVIAKLGHTLTTDRVAGIQQLVAAAVPELLTSEVTVLDGDGRVVSQISAPVVSRSPENDERSAAQAYFSARARAALATTLPGMPFAVRTLILDDASALKDAGSHDQAAPDTPASMDSTTRKYPLRVIVISPTALAGDDQGVAREAVTGAIALDGRRGDSISFEVGPIDPTPAPMAVTASTRPAVPLPSASSSPSPASDNRLAASTVVISGLVVLLAMIAVVWLRSGGIPRIERESFVARLREQLSVQEPRDAGV